jgi:hypothetical protein
MKKFALLLILSSILCGQSKAAGNDSLKVKKLNPIKIEIGVVGGYNFSGNTYTGDDLFEGIIGGFSVGWKRKQLNYKVRFDYGSEIQLMAVKVPTESISDFSFLVGKEFRNNSASFSFFGGPGLLWSTKRGDKTGQDSGWFGKSYYRDVSKSNLALAFECNIMYRVLHQASSGICFFGNLTPENSLFGVMMKVGF